MRNGSSPFVQQFKDGALWYQERDLLLFLLPISVNATQQLVQCGLPKYRVQHNHAGSIGQCDAIRLLDILQPKQSSA